MQAATERWAVVLTAGLMVIGAGTPVDESLDGLIAGNTAARGGPAAIEAVHSVLIDVRIEEPRFTVDAQYRAARDGSMRVDVFDGDGSRVYTEALEGGRAWSQAAGDDSPVTPVGPRGAAALRNGVESPLKLFGLHELTQRGHALEYRGREIVDGTDYYVIRATFDDGREADYYLNPASALIERERQYRALHVDADPQPHWIETRYADYRPVDGVLFPFRQVESRLDTGEVLATSTIRRIVVNPRRPRGSAAPAAPSRTRGHVVAQLLDPHGRGRVARRAPVSAR
jgi:hypothetical protein